MIKNTVIGKTTLGDQYHDSMVESGFSIEEANLALQAYEQSPKHLVKEAGIKIMYLCSLQADPHWSGKTFPEKITRVASINPKHLRKAFRDFRRAQ